MEEDKQAIQDFGTADSGASLGDILGAAIRRRNQQEQRRLRRDPNPASGRGFLGALIARRLIFCSTGGASSAA